MTAKDWDQPSPQLLQRAERRIFTLFLQAAHREGLLSTKTFQAEKGELSWGEGSSRLKVAGKVYSSGQRLRIEALPEGLNFEESLQAVAQSAKLSTEAPQWGELLAELKGGVRVQAAAYQAALERAKPNCWESLECWTPEGHNLHPGAKTREGFTVEDQLAYSPDFAETLSMPWITVEKSLLSPSGEVPSLFDLGDRWAVPVHPWQRREILFKTYPQEWETGKLADLDRPPIEAHLSTSLRTVVPTDPALPIFKLSVGSLMTSTERSMSRHTVMHGPIFSELLRRAIAKAPPWAERVSLMDEPGGLYWSNTSDQPTRSRQLSLLFRRRPETPPGWMPVPCSCLPQPWGEGLQGHLGGALFSRGAGPLANFERYCQLLIPFHLGLMMEAGIALEAHLQNCVVLWSQDGPEALWVRDWGGLRADSKLLRELFPDLWQRLDPSALTLTDAKAARRKLLACLYSNHLSEVVVFLAEQFGLAETALWEKVARITREALSQWPDSPLEREILRDPWPVKSLLRLRLGAPGEDYRSLPNPLPDVNLFVTSSLDTQRLPQ